MVGKIGVREVRKGIRYNASLRPSRYLPNLILKRLFSGKARLQEINRRGKTILVSVDGNQLTTREVREWLTDVLSTWDEIPADWFEVDSSDFLRGNPAWNTIDTADARHTASAKGFLEYVHELWTQEMDKADAEVQDDGLIGGWEDMEDDGLHKYLARQRRRANRRSELTERVRRVLASWTANKAVTLKAPSHSRAFLFLVGFLLLSLLVVGVVYIFFG